MKVSGGPRRLDVVLGEEPELSRSAAARLIREGHVRVNGAIARPSHLVAEGDAVEVDMPEASPSAFAAESVALRFLYEDDDFAVIDKPAGMVVHPSAGHHSGTLVNALLGEGGSWSTIGGESRPGIVHRLDKGTSGLIVVARNDAAHLDLSRQLAERTLSRTYLAIVRGKMQHQSGVLEGDIARDPHDRQRMAVVERGRHARTRYSVVEQLRGYSLLMCELETGRTHQVRVHLAASGHPIAGDPLYARPRAGEPDRPMLHALRLRLRHPRSGVSMQFESPPPADLVDFLESKR